MTFLDNMEEFFDKIGGLFNKIEWMELLDASAVEWWLPASYVILVGLVEFARTCRKRPKSRETSENPLQAPLLDGALPQQRVFIPLPYSSALPFFKQEHWLYIILMGYVCACCTCVCLEVGAW